MSQFEIAMTLKKKLNCINSGNHSVPKSKTLFFCVYIHIDDEMKCLLLPHLHKYLRISSSHQTQPQTSNPFIKADKLAISYF